MSSNFNIRKEKCFSCEFYNGTRRFKNGLVLGASIETNNDGVCSNKRSRDFNQKIDDNHWCAKYEKWRTVLSEIQRQDDSAAKLKEQRLEREEKTRQENLETERKIEVLENEKQIIIDSMSPEEKALNEEEKKRDKEKQEKELRQKEFLRQQNEINKKRKIRKFAIVFTIIVVAIAVLIVSIVLISNSIKSSKKNNSSEGKLRTYINRNGTDNKVTEVLSSDVLGSGYKCSFTLSYSETGYSEGIGSGTYSTKGKYQFLLVSTVLQAPSFESSESYGVIIFNWDDLKSFNNVITAAELHYGSNMVVHHYNQYKMSSYPNPTFGSVWHGYGEWDNSIDLDASSLEGWDACITGMKYLNKVSNVIYSENLW